MKPNRFLSLLAATLFAIVLAILIAPGAFAGTADPGLAISADATTAIPVEAQNAILGFFLKQAIAHPWFATLLAFAALMRVWAKPLSTVLHFIVDLTPTDRDDGALNAIMRWFANTGSGRFLAWLIDWVTSIKIIPPALALAALLCLPSCSLTYGADGSKSATVDGAGLAQFAKVIADK